MKSSHILLLLAAGGGAAYLAANPAKWLGWKNWLAAKLTPSGAPAEEPADGGGAPSSLPSAHALDEGAPAFQNGITGRVAAGVMPLQVDTRKQAVLIGLR